MNYLVNEAYIKAQAAKARRTQFIGVGLVFISFLASLLIADPQYAWLVFFSYPALIVGFPLWQIGRGRSRRWTEELKVPARLAAELKGVSTKHALYSYVPLPSGPVIDHLVVGPDGFYVVKMKTGGFPVTVVKQNDKDRWSEKLPILERLARMGEENLGNPSVALEGEIAALKSWLADNKLASSEVPVYGVVVFRDPKTTIDGDDPEFEPLLLDELKSFIMTPLPEDEGSSGARVPTDDRNRIAAAIRTLIGEGAPAAPAGGKTAAPATGSTRISTPIAPKTAATPSSTKATPASSAKPTSGTRTAPPPAKPRTNGAAPRDGLSKTRKET